MTGPKTSVRAISLPGATPSSTVGRTKRAAFIARDDRPRPSTSMLGSFRDAGVINPSMRFLLALGDNRTHLHTGFQAVADHALAGRLGERPGNSSCLAYRYRQRGGQAALPGAAKGAVSNNFGGHFQIRIWQDDHRVFCPALALSAFAVGSGPAVNVTRHLGGADKADALTSG